MADDLLKITIGDLLDRQAARFGDHDALIHVEHRRLLHRPLSHLRLLRTRYIACIERDISRLLSGRKSQFGCARISALRYWLYAENRSRSSAVQSPSRLTSSAKRPPCSSIWA